MANYAMDQFYQHQANMNVGRGQDYSGLLKQAQGQYKGILAGYANALRGQQRQQRQTMQGYNQLQANVLGGLAGAGTARSQELADYYTEQSGRAQQDLVNRGLGNTTVASSVGARYVGDQAKQQTLLANEVAENNARYQSQLGLAGLQYRDAANRQRMGLMGQQLGYQGDYQKALGDWAMRGMGMSYSGRGSGGGYGGGPGTRGGGNVSIGSGMSPYAERAYYDRQNDFEIPNPFAGSGYGYGGATYSMPAYEQPFPVARHGIDYTAGIHDWDLAGEYN